MLGARGGIGCSTLTLGVGLAAADAGLRVVLVDTDVHGQGLSRLAGLVPGSTSWATLSASGPVAAPARMLAGLPLCGGARILGFDGSAQFDTTAAAVVISDLAADVDLVLVDMPLHLHMGQRWSPWPAVVLIGPDVTSLQAAHRCVRGPWRAVGLCGRGPLAPDVVLASCGGARPVRVPQVRGLEFAADFQDAARVLSRGSFARSCTVLLDRIREEPGDGG